MNDSPYITKGDIVTSDLLMQRYLIYVAGAYQNQQQMAKLLYTYKRIYIKYQMDLLRLYRISVMIDMVLILCCTSSAMFVFDGMLNAVDSYWGLFVALFGKLVMLVASVVFWGNIIKTDVRKRDKQDNLLKAIISNA